MSVESRGRFEIRRFTQEAYDQLKVIAGEKPELWFDETTDFAQVLTDAGIKRPVETCGVVATEPIEIRPAEKGPPNRGDKQGLAFYRALEGVSPKVATDERMWAWIAHFVLHSYSIKRWRRQKNTNLTRHIERHWFVDDPREGLWMYNTGSRM